MMNKWMTAKSAVALVVIFSFIGNTACSANGTRLLDAAVSAADATVAVLAASGVVPAQDEAYVKAILDALNFATQELASDKTPTQIAIDIANQFKNVELPDLTGLTPQQVSEMQALAAAVAAFLQPFRALAAANQSPTIALLPISFQMTFTERLHLMSVHRHINRLEKTVRAIRIK